MKKEFSITPEEMMSLEYILASNGFKNTSVCISENGKTVIITFEDDIDYAAFLLKGILMKAQEESRLNEANIDFMIKVEKILDSYSKFDEFILRKVLKDT